MEQMTAFSELIESHVEDYAGEIEMVIHPTVDFFLHIDLLIIRANEKCPFNLLVTSGMSSLPMNCPEGLEEESNAELLFLLPKDWPMPNSEDIISPNSKSAAQWPLEQLLDIAYIPHLQETWFGYGSTLTLNEPLPNTRFTAVIFLPSFCLPEEFLELPADAHTTIKFLSLVPLYEEELEIVFEKDAYALLDLFNKQGITDIFDPTRKNVALAGR